MSKPEFVYVTYIETTPEKFWHALTDGDFTETLLVRPPLRLGLEGRLDLRDGAQRRHRLRRRQGRRMRPAAAAGLHVCQSVGQIQGRVPALATFTLEPYGKLVKLTLTHEGFAEGSKFFTGISKGWPAILSSLKSLLETGKPLEIPYDAMKMDG